jgi:PAS domain S-box-containing protein
VLKSEKLYRSMVEGSLQGILIHQKSVIRYANPAFARIFGYGSPEEVLGRDVWDVLSAVEERPALQSRTSACLRGEPLPVHQGWKAARQDGTEVWVESTASVISWQDRPAVLAFFVDITERRRAEQRLEESYALVRAVTEGITDALFVKDLEGRYLMMNSAGAQIVGKPAGQVIGKKDTDLFSPGTASRLVQADRRVMATGETQTYEETATAAGLTRTYLTTKSPYRDAQGNTLGVVGIARDISEHKQAEEALSRQREEQQVILDSVPALVFYKDRENRFIRVNKALADLTGKLKEEIEGRSAFEVYPEQANDYWADDKHVMASGEPRRNIVEPLMTTQGLRWIQTDKIPYRNGQGDIVGIIGFSLDITERKQAEEALRDSEERFHTMANTVPVMIWTSGPDKRCDWFNKPWLEFTGRSLEQEVGYGWTDSIHPEDFKRCLYTYERCFDARESFQMEYRIRRADGQYRWVIDTGIPRFTQDGSFTGYIGSAVDMTERKQVEEQLQRSQEQLAEAQRVAHLGSWEWDIETDAVAWSEECFRLFGRDPQEVPITYARFLESVHPEDRERVRQDVEQALEKREPYDLDYRVLHPNGTVRVLHGRGKVILDADGRPFKVIGTAQNVTERKQAEESLAKHAAELTRSNAELERFAYVASHDLQEPLRMVTSFTQLLAKRYRDKLDKDADEYIAFILDGTRRMHELINDLLAYSRVGRYEQQFKPTNCGEVLSRVLGNLRAAIADTGAQVTHDPLPTLVADRFQLEQLLQNLLSNALKFRGEEPPRIHVSARQQGSEWVFSVRDNGIGVDPQFAGRIFVIFQRLHSRKEYPGTGIGLAICKKIVERHGGRIWVESEPGRGATFYFTVRSRGVALHHTAR